jgi:hypothetical protein
MVNRSSLINDIIIWKLSEMLGCKVGITTETSGKIEMNFSGGELLFGVIMTISLRFTLLCSKTFSWGSYKLIERVVVWTLGNDRQEREEVGK